MHAPAASQRLRRDAPLLEDSLRAGLLLAELLFNVPVDFARVYQVCPKATHATRSAGEQSARGPRFRSCEGLLKTDT